MDIGGDKPGGLPQYSGGEQPVPWLPRGAYLHEEYSTLFTTQLRAILRASAHGSLKIMIPMISSMEEILWVKEKVASETALSQRARAV